MIALPLRAAGLLVLTASGRPIRALLAGEVLVLTIVAVTVLSIVVMSAGAARRLVTRSMWYAVAAGMAFGVSSAITQTVVVRVSHDGILAVLSPAAVVVLVLAVGGLLLAQAAYRGGLGRRWPC